MVLSGMQALEGATERLKLFSAGLQDPGAFDAPIAGCDAVFHVASPLPVGKGSEDPENVVLRPAIEGTENALQACLKTPSLKVLVLTSSMSAMAPVPEPELKSEEHWSDPEGQKSRGSWYGASKTLAEKKAYELANGAHFRLASICPTMVVGPMIQPEMNMTMGALCNWLKNGRSNGQCPNDSMSFVDVRDCAAQHVAAMENESCSGRYMSLESSWHWNELDVLFKEIYPEMPVSKPCEGTPVKPTQFDLTRQKSLGVELRKVPEIIRSAKDELVAKGHLP
eukprot:TRINITY_DN2569_c3_g1_i1.p1 TRINITY_DN2569_c3_g1~~TRINITY_DN2569_c3_g1_i1.p1  ORF type:complete len:281 (-),score=53.70 TRINITY_DN2569_c3_g1_i1:145-987(-)